MSEAQTLGIQAQHQAALAEGYFLIQKCSACGQHIYFPRDLCPHCGSGDVSFVEPKGTGIVYSTSCVDNMAATEVKIGQRVKAKVALVNGRGRVMFDAVSGGSA